MAFWSVLGWLPASPLLLYTNTLKSGKGFAGHGPPTQDSFVIDPKINALKLCSIYKILRHPDSFVSRDSIFGLAGHRAGALFFARTKTISS